MSTVTVRSKHPGTISIPDDGIVRWLGGVIDMGDEWRARRARRRSKQTERRARMARKRRRGWA